MARTMLVGLDGSAHSASAVELGIQWAAKQNAMLVGLGIIDEPTIRKPEPTPLGAGRFKAERDEALLHAARRTVEQILEQFALRCAAAGVACKLLEDVGLPAARICLEAQRYDLILLGRNTYFHFETQSHADETFTKVVKSSPRPLVAVPERLGSGSAVVVAYDGSLQAARTLQAFVGMELQLSAHVHVVAVHADHGEAVRHAERAIDFLGFHGFTTERHALKSSAPAAAILEQVTGLDAGLLVMGAYGQPALREFVFGSVTRTLLKEAAMPLFLYH